jgi:LAO/AO transport system kinase
LKTWHGWRPPVLQAQAQDGVGIDAVVEALGAHRSALEHDGGLARKRRRGLESRVSDLVLDRLARDVLETPAARARLAAGCDAIERGESTPYRLTDAILEAGRRDAGGPSNSKG